MPVDRPLLAAHLAYPATLFAGWHALLFIAAPLRGYDPAQVYSLAISFFIMYWLLATAAHAIVLAWAASRLDMPGRRRLPSWASLSAVLTLGIGVPAEGQHVLFLIASLFASALLYGIVVWRRSRGERTSPAT